MKPRHPRPPRPALGLCAALVCASLCGACGGAEEETAARAEPPPGPPEPFSVLTFNVLCSFCGADEYDTWDERLPAFEDLFSRHDPDLMGLQELALAGEVDQMLALRPGFAAIYFVNDDSGFAYPDATILYRAERFEQLEHGHYWLSPTPDQPSSTGFAENQLPRLVRWARLRDRVSRRPIYFASTHFDNNSPSQDLSAPLVLEQTAPFAAEQPVVLVGDFNSQPADPAYQALVEGDGKELGFTNAQDLAETWTVETNVSPAPDYDLEQRIDHIFVAGSGVTWSAPLWTVDLHVYGPNDRYPSDHRAMFARLSYAEP